MITHFTKGMSSKRKLFWRKDIWENIKLEMSTGYASDIVIYEVVIPWNPG